MNPPIVGRDAMVEASAHDAVASGRNLGARAHDAAPRTARVAVIGSSGYAGQEFVRLAAGHPGVTIAALGSREHAGRPAGDMIAGLDSRVLLLPEVAEAGALAALATQGAFDTLVVSLPNGGWTALASQHPVLADRPLRIIDLSGDHRADGVGYTYGLPELGRAAIAVATRVANPGCYATAATLALLPAAEAGWLEAPVMIGALSGVSGAGRSPQLRTSFVERDGGATLYQVGDAHPHVAEIARNLAAVGMAAPIGFAPALVPMARGILLTASGTLAQPVTPEHAHERYARRFAGEAFVRVLEIGSWPETRAVRGSNRCDIAVTTLHGGRTLLVAAALDNLVKGGAGQALQNLNLMLGWPEACALPRHGSPW